MIWRAMLSRILFRRSGRELARAYRAVASTGDGALVIADLLAFCRVDEDCHVPGEPDSTAFNLGRRRVGLRIKAFCEKPLREFAALHADWPDHDEDLDDEEFRNVA